MNGRAEKLTELDAVNSVSNADVLYLVSNGVSYQVNLAVITQYILNLAAQQDTD
jgi:hypothetical protein